MKRLVTVTGPVAAAQMNGYLIEERLLDHIMIQVMDNGDGNLEIAFDERDRRYLSQLSAAQLADWLHEAMLHVVVLLRKNGERLMKQEDLHAEDPFYERVSG